MRPGQLTPENSPAPFSRAARRGRFNEAGAINPGKPRTGSAQLLGPRMASMRPGQLTPENPNSDRQPTVTRRCFNEAGAINPGKHPLAPPVQIASLMLQ